MSQMRVTFELTTLRANLLGSRGYVINMIAQSNKEIEEELRAAVVHLQLHGAAPLEGAAAADDESEVVCSQLGIRVGRVGIRISRRCKNGAALDARLCLASSVEMQRCD